MIQATPTLYRGIEFASRLEADWAAMLDHLEMPWQYEPCSYQMTSGNYLPDFYLPEQRIWAEVKGPMDQRLEKTRQFRAQLLKEGNSKDPFEAELVIVLRAATRGWAMWEGAIPEDDFILSRCPYCKRHGFVYCGRGVKTWDCRHCAAPLDDDIKVSGFGEMWFYPNEDIEGNLLMRHAPGWRERIRRSK